MVWFIQTSFSGVVLGPKDFQDLIVADSKGFGKKVWDDDWNLYPGSPLVLLHNPGPAARGTLDDETYTTPFIGPTLPTATNVAGGRRFSAQVLRSKWNFQNQLTYQIWPNFIDPGEFWNDDTDLHILVRNSLDELPGMMKKEALLKAYRLATTQEGLHGVWERPAWIPSGRYGDEKCRVLSEIQRHFLEPVIDGGVSWQLWSQEEVHKVLEMRIHRFLVETGIIRKEELRSVGQGSTEIDVPQDSIEIRRVDFEYSDRRQKPRALFRIDTQQADSGIVGWDDVEGEPHSYIEDPMVNSMTIRACPLPDGDGQVSIRYVPMPQLSMSILCEPLPIPRMFTWVVKWGVIADLLKKEGEANDTVRAKAAEDMYNFGVGIAKHLVGART